MTSPLISTATVEFDFGYVMKHYERASIKIFAPQLAAQIEEAEAFGARARTLEALYSNLQFTDFAPGYAALADASSYEDLQAYRVARTSTLGATFATANLADVNQQLPEFSPLPFYLAVEKRLGEQAALINGNSLDRMLWRMYRVFCEPERLEQRPSRIRQRFLLSGLESLTNALPKPVRQQWLDRGWPQISEFSPTELIRNPLDAVLVRKAWVQL